jgi:hypothetical protein
MALLLAVDPNRVGVLDLDLEIGQTAAFSGDRLTIR